MPTERKFVVVSGLPGSGKSTLAHQLAPLLGLTVIDKDDILERMFDLEGSGDSTRRRALSRESDLIFKREAEASEGSLLVSHWRQQGMPPDSGTPVDWLPKLSSRIVNLQCECPVEIAAERFAQRKRHPGHLDEARSRTQIFESIHDLARYDCVWAGKQVSVDTSAEIDLEDLAGKISQALTSRD